MPLISVLMPVFNGQRYLEAALNSVLGQTFSDFEFVVVDDGSTDDTPRILERCRDSRLGVIRINHAGLIAALNEGISRCSAPFIARMDADDLSYPSRFRRQYELLCDNAQIDVVTCWSDLLDASGRVIGQRTDSVGQDMLLDLASGNQIVHGSVMIRRACLPSAPVYSRPPEDYWLWAQLARANKRFHCIPEVHYAFRAHGDRYSLTHARSQSAGIVEVQWLLLEECSTSRCINEPAVRSRLVHGWGAVAGAAYCSNNRARANEARRRFLELAGSDWDGELNDAIEYGIESMIWGGCPWYTELGLRLRQCKQHPMVWKSYRNLLLSLPPIRWLR